MEFDELFLRAISLLSPISIATTFQSEEEWSEIPHSISSFLQPGLLRRKFDIYNDIAFQEERQRDGNKSEIALRSYIEEVFTETK